MVRPLREEGGGGVRALATKKKAVFEAQKKILEKMLWPLSSRGPKTVFCGFPYHVIY